MNDDPTESTESTDDDAESRGGSIGAWLLGVIVSTVFLAGVIWLAEPREIWSVLQSADPAYIGLAVACYALVLVARWFRLFAFQDSEPKTRSRIELLWASAGHSFATQLLPARLGELVFPGLWFRATRQPHADGLVALLAVRLVELAVLTPIWGVAFFIFLARPGGESPGALAGWLPWLATAAGLTLLIGLPVVLHSVLGGARWLLKRTPLANWRLTESLRNALPDAQQAVERLGTRNLFWVALMTFIAWMGLFGVFGFSLEACGADLGWAQTVVGAGGGIVGNVLPVGGIGSIGVMEAGWTAAFRATGAPLEPVVAAGLLVHALVILGAGIGAGVGYAVDALS